MAETITIPVGGMSCSHCVQTLEKGLGKIEGVKNVNVELNEKRATMEITGDLQALRKQVEATILKLGFKIRTQGN